MLKKFGINWMYTYYSLGCPFRKMRKEGSNNLLQKTLEQNFFSKLHDKLRINLLPLHSPIGMIND
jgi:hypothetical protein